MPYAICSPPPRTSLSASCIQCRWHHHAEDAREKAKRHSGATGHTTEVTLITITQYEKRKDQAKDTPDAIS